MNPDEKWTLSLTRERLEIKISDKNVSVIKVSSSLEDSSPNEFQVFLNKRTYKHSSSEKETRSNVLKKKYWKVLVKKKKL